MFDKNCLHYYYVHNIDIRYPFRVFIHRNLAYLEFVHEEVYEIMAQYTPELTFVANKLAYMGDGIYSKMLSNSPDNFGTYNENKIFEVMKNTEKLKYLGELEKSLNRIFHELDPSASIFVPTNSKYLLAVSPQSYVNHHSLDNLAYHYYIKLLSQTFDGYGTFYVDGNINDRPLQKSRKLADISEACEINAPVYFFDSFAYINYKRFLHEILQKMLAILHMDRNIYESVAINNLQIDRLIAFTEKEVGNLL
jgi:hypothetical protein